MFIFVCFVLFHYYFFFLSSVLIPRHQDRHVGSKMMMAMAFRNGLRKASWPRSWSTLESALGSTSNSQQLCPVLGISQLPKEAGDLGLAQQQDCESQGPKFCYDSTKRSLITKKNQFGILSWFNLFILKYLLFTICLRQCARHL